MIKDPRTTFGGLVCLLAVIGLLLHKIDLSACVTILGIAGSVIGFASKDSGTTPPTTVVTESLTKCGVTATSTTVETKQS